MAEFKDRFKEALEASGMRCADLARKLEISEQNLSRYKNGIMLPKRESLRQLAAAFNVSEAWLAGYDAPKQERKRETLVLNDETKLLYNRLQDALLRISTPYDLLSIEQKTGVPVRRLRVYMCSYQSMQFIFKDIFIEDVFKIAQASNYNADYILLGEERKENTMENEKDKIQEEREALLAALAIIRDTCKQHDKACFDCPLFVRNNCRLRDRPDPSGWQLVGDPSTWRAFL